MPTTLMFEPTLAAARARIAAVHPASYALTRNQLDGAVTQLSPYLTHGFVSLPEVLAAVRRRHPVNAQHKLVYEFGWREYFHHVWRFEGERIFSSLHPGPLPDDAYSPELPADIREARTGVPAIDQAVRMLYATGWLHNHARMWLASYVVHLRKVHWRAGADWLYGHLLDGDLASNHLSWQWVAGTGSHKPYLFNAENVARYAPPDWHSPGTPIDTSYEALDVIARSPKSVLVKWPSGRKGSQSAKGLDGGQGGDFTGVARDGLKQSAEDRGGIEEPPLFHIPPPGCVATQAATPALLGGHNSWLVHPWSLGEPPAHVRLTKSPPLSSSASSVPTAASTTAPTEFESAIERSSASTPAVGVLLAEFHRRWPWSAARWQFIGARMSALCERVLWCETPLPVTLRGRSDPHALPWLGGMDLDPEQRMFAEPGMRCKSFSQFWTRVNR